MTSHPPAHCCVVGVKHEGESTGKLENVGDVSTYFVQPPSPTDKGILILTDVIGHKFINAQLIADQFAANGFVVAVPDLFFGDPLPLNRGPDFDFNAWRAKHGPEVTDPIIEAAIKNLREQHGVKRLGTVGYCFGGKYVARFGAEGKGVDVGYTAHPSFVSASDLDGVAIPLSIAAAQTDHIFPADKRAESVEILSKKSIPWQLNLYSGVEHGFAVRGDISKQEKRFAKEAAFEQAVTWFKEWL